MQSKTYAIVFIMLVHKVFFFFYVYTSKPDHVYIYLSFWINCGNTGTKSFFINARLIALAHAILMNYNIFFSTSFLSIAALHLTFFFFKHYNYFFCTLLTIKYFFYFIFFIIHQYKLKIRNSKFSITFQEFKLFKTLSTISLKKKIPCTGVAVVNGQN